MTDRIHAVLDGELAREALQPDELARLVAMEAALGEIAGPLRGAPVPELTERVMRALPPRPAPRPSAWERVQRWMWAPREFAFTFRPAYALAGLATAALAGVLLLSPPSNRIDSSAPLSVAMTSPSPRVYVQFRLDVNDASRVEVAGSFTGWEPTVELHERTPGIWTALVPLDPGVHDYTFVIDGRRWIPDPTAPQVSDDFGGTNSRLFLPAPGERSI
jgi:hypothetical protein